MEKIVASLLVLFCIFGLASGHYNPPSLDRGYALRFNGANQFVDLPSLSFGSRVTIEFYARYRGIGGPIMNFLTTGNDQEVRVNLGPSGISFTSCGSRTSCSTISYSGPAIVLNQWTYFALVRNTDGSASIYTKTNTGSVQLLSNGNLNTFNWIERRRASIGRSFAGQFFNGDIDNVRLWSRVLSTSELALNPLARTSSDSLIGEWRFDEGTGVAAYDSSGNRYTASLGGGNSNLAPTWIISGNPTATCRSWSCGRIRTFDRYVFSTRNLNPAVGDFWFVKNSPALQIQTRYNAVRGRPFLTGVAFKTANNDLLVMDLDFTSKFAPVITLNGRDISNIASFTSPFSFQLTQRSSAKYSYSIQVPNTFDMGIDAYPRAAKSHLWVRLPVSGNQGLIANSLCGNLDSSAGNDFTVVRSASVAANENFFANSIPPTNVDTTFCNIATLPNPTFVAQANSICGNTSIVSADLALACLEDICIAGELSAGTETAITTYEECLESNAGTGNLCQVPCPGFCSMQGTCQAPGVCQCISGFYGNDCSQQRSFACYQANWNNGQETQTLTPFSEFGKTVVQHYKYDTVYDASSATGNEVSEATVAYLYVEKSPIPRTNTLPAPDKVSLVVLNDKARDGTGGSASLRVTLNGGSPLNGIGLTVRDDPDDSFSVTATSISANWNWWRCCTDGLAIGPLPNSNSFCLDLRFTFSSGLNRFFLSSRNDIGSQDLLGIDLAAGSPPQDLKICGSTCNNPCVVYTDCSTCIADPQCGWCPETASCQIGFPEGPRDSYCPSWRWSVDAADSRVLRRDLGYPVNPSLLGVYVAPAKPLTASFDVTIPPSDQRGVDVVYVQDVSSSFGTALPILSCYVRKFYEEILDAFPNARVGLAAFSDFPANQANLANNFAYQTVSPLGRSGQLFQASFKQLGTRQTPDNQLSQLSVLNLLATSRYSEMGFDDNAFKVVVIVTRNLYGQGGVYPAVSDLKSALLAANIFPVFVTSSSVLSSYQSLVASLGFGRATSFSDSSIPSIIPEALDSVLQASQILQAFVLTRGMITSVTPVSGYFGLSPYTRATFQVDFSTSAGSGDSKIVVLGYGSVNVKAYGAECIQPTQTAPFFLNPANGTQVLVLDGNSDFANSQSLITGLPSSGNVYQYSDGTLGTPITVAFTAVKDPMKRVIYVPNTRVSDRLVYRVVADCGCQSRDVTVTTLALDPTPVTTQAQATTGQFTTAQQTTQQRTTQQQTTSVTTQQQTTALQSTQQQTTAQQTTRQQTTAQQTTALQSTQQQTTALRTTQQQTTQQQTTSVTTQQQTTALQSTQQQTTALQTTQQQTTALQTTAIRTTGEQTTALRTTQFQSTAELTTALQSTQAQTTALQTTQQQTTQQQTTALQTTQQQTTALQTTGLQTTAQQTTALQTTQQQTTAEQTTALQTTQQQTTALQTTQQQTTAEQTTQQQTTALQSTSQQTTAIQTTAEQTTQIRTTSVTTGEQTTALYTTEEQTTQQQTTAIQTTSIVPIVTTAQQTTAPALPDCTKSITGGVTNSSIFEDTNTTLSLFFSTPSGAVQIVTGSAPARSFATFYTINGNQFGNQFLDSDNVVLPTPFVGIAPGLNVNGAIGSLTFTITDPQCPSTPAAVITFPVFIFPVNDPPVAATPQNFLLNLWDQSNAQQLCLVDLQVSDVDVPDTLTLTITSFPSDGSLQFVTTTTGAITPLDSNSPSFVFRLPLTSSPSQINRLQYVHNIVVAKVVTFAYTVSDGTVVVGPFVASLDVSNIVNQYVSYATNPTNATFLEDNSYTFDLVLFDADSLGTTPTLIIRQLPQQGTLSAYGSDVSVFLNPDPADPTYQIPTTDLNGDGKYGTVTFTYTPNANSNGVDTFTYTGQDELGLRFPIYQTFSLVVEAVNDAPTLTPAVAPPTPITLAQLVAADVDVDPTTTVVAFTVQVSSGLLNYGVYSGQTLQINTTLSPTPFLSIGFTGVTTTCTVTVNDLGSFGIGGPLSVTRTYTISPASEINAATPPNAAVNASFVGLTGVLGIVGAAVYRVMKKKKMLAEDADPWQNDDMFENQLDNPVYSTNNVTAPPE